MSKLFSPSLTQSRCANIITSNNLAFSKGERHAALHAGKVKCSMQTTVGKGCQDLAFLISQPVKKNKIFWKHGWLPSGFAAACCLAFPHCTSQSVNPMFGVAAIAVGQAVSFVSDIIAICRQLSQR